MLGLRSGSLLAALSLLGAGALWSGAAQAACTPLTASGVPSATQDFNGLSSVVATGVAWTDDATVPGWYSTRTAYNVATGSSNAGALYSFGVAGTNPNTDRALGGIASGGTGTFFWAGCYVNNTGAPLTSVTIAYTGEQWRDGGNAVPVAQTMVFQYQVANAGVITDADTPTTGWTNAAALDFSSPTFTTTAAALDGNLAANRTVKNGSITVAVAAGQEIWIRWQDLNDAGNDHGLAVDDVAVTGTGSAAAAADLTIVLADSPDPVVAGANLTYTATLTNLGPSDAQGANLTLTLPAGTSFVSATASGTGTCNAVSPVVCTWAGATQPGAPNARTATVVALVPANTASGTTLNASVVAASTTPDPVPGNNTATAGTGVITSANLSITLTDAPDPVTAGSNLTYVATLTNAGLSDAQGANISLPLPAPATFVSANPSAGGVCVGPAVGANGTVTCTWAGATAPGAANARTATIIANVPAATADGTVLLASAVAASTTNDPTPANNQATTTTTVAAQADLSITLTDAPDPVTAGTQLTYTATLTNAGVSDAQAVSISLPLPSGTSFVSANASSGGTCNAVSPVVCTWAGATAPGGVRSASIVVLVAPSQLASLSATATAASTTTDPNPANNSATATTNVVAAADLSLTLTDAPDPVAAGTNLTYTATVSNAGPSDATGVTVTLPLPAGTTFVSGSGATCAGSPVVCTVSGSIAPLATRVVTIVVAVSPSAMSGSVITATATVSATTPDPNPGNNSATTTTTVITSADLVIALTASATQTATNVPVTFTATSQNLGPSAAQNVSITLTLTPDFRFSSLTAPGATCTTPQIGNTGSIVCTWAGDTASGVTRTLSVVAYSNNEGTSSVNASTTSNTPDPVANNNAASVSVVVGFQVEGIPSLNALGLLLLTLALGVLGMVAVRRPD